MMAVGHATVAGCVGGYTCLAVGASPLVAVSVSASVTVLVALAMAGAALVPDLDHHGATITDAFGPVSWAAHRGLVRLHHAVADATWDPGESEPGAHRGLSHWWPFPLALSVAVGVPCVVWPQAAWPVLTILVYVAILGVTVPEYRDDPDADPRRRMARSAAHTFAGLVPTVALLKMGRRSIRRGRGVSNVWLVRVLLRRERNDTLPTRVVKAVLRPVLGVVTVRFALFAVVGWFVWWVLSQHLWVGLLVGPVLLVGMVLHLLTDAPTWSRVPGWTLRGEFRWPHRLSFGAGGAFEVGVVWTVASLAGGVGLWLAVWPEVAPVVAETWTAVQALRR